MPAVGDEAPDFALPSTEGELRLSELAAQGKVVLAFYAEDSTPLCSTEVAMLKDDYGTVRELGAQVVAISADSVESHRDFVARLGGVPFPLASDERLEAARAYGVVGEDGRRCRRAVFVIEGGRIVHANAWFQPGNSSQYEAVFRALGFEG